MIVLRFTPSVMEGSSIYEDGILGVEYEEMTLLMDTLRKVFGNTFLESSDEDGIQKLEKLYHIPIDETKSLEERKAIVYGKIIYKPPFTQKKVIQLIDNMFGKGNYVCMMSPKDFSVTLSAKGYNSNTISNYYSRIRIILPSNLKLLTSVPYTYIYLLNMTYADAGEHTYGELSLYNEGGVYSMTRRGGTTR